MILSLRVYSDPWLVCYQGLLLLGLGLGMHCICIRICQTQTTCFSRCTGV
jgi:hypothetical protein